MKKIYFMFVLTVFTTVVFAQKPISLHFETHALKSESNNTMQLCKYVDPGKGGENVGWNFSSLDATNNFTGLVQSNYHSVNSEIFPRANTELQEFNNQFYFMINENRIEQYGYSSKDNSVIIKFDKPFVKMEFPFTMGDHFSGDYHGIYKTSKNETDISGTYEVVADGYGKLMLPGNVTYDNTLRVKTIKNYTRELENMGQDIEIITYRWYCEFHRYPLLVLTKIKSTTGSSISESYQAAYNNLVNTPAKLNKEKTVTDKLFEVYPNPVDNVLTVKYEVSEKSDVMIELFDLTGKKVKSLINKEMDSGLYSIELNVKDEEISKGTYLLKVKIDNKTRTKEIIVLK
jgi:hypothetical protein